MLKRKKLLVCIVLLYAVTWVGGWHSHAQQLRDHAEEIYRRGERRNQEIAAEAEMTGTKYRPVELRKGGPASEVDWCVPLLPGVLLTHSAYFVGPSSAKGGYKVVLYYGFGSKEVCFFGWRA